MNIDEFLKKHEQISLHGTGGNCTAFFAELNTKQDYILITGDDCEVPTDHDDNYTIGLYLNGDSAPTHTFETTNIDHLSEQVDAIYTLWGY